MSLFFVHKYVQLAGPDVPRSSHHRLISPSPEKACEQILRIVKNTAELAELGREITHADIVLKTLLGDPQYGLPNEKAYDGRYDPDGRKWRVPRRSKGAARTPYQCACLECMRRSLQGRDGYCRVPSSTSKEVTARSNAWNFRGVLGVSRK